MNLDQGEKTSTILVTDFVTSTVINQITTNQIDIIINSNTSNISNPFIEYGSIEEGSDHYSVTGLPPEKDWTFLFMILLMGIGIAGNLLVCMAIFLEKKLQNPTNFFLFSLAIADLVVCLIVMPITIIKCIYGYWPFSAGMCTFWVTCDVLCCTSSIIHMCFISVQRRMGIKDPLKARKSFLSSKRSTVFRIIGAWILSAGITSVLIIWSLVDVENIQPLKWSCQIANPHFEAVGSILAFYLPMAIMVHSYVPTVWLLRKKALMSKGVQSQKKQKMWTKKEKEGKKSGLTKQCLGDSSGADGEESGDDSGNAAMVAEKLSQRRQTMAMIRNIGSKSRIRTEEKATWVLGLVFAVFFICWTPFFTLNFVGALFHIFTDKDLNISDSVATTLQWLGFVSSAINPVIYTTFSNNFRQAFRKLLVCQTDHRRRSSSKLRRGLFGKDCSWRSSNRSKSSKSNNSSTAFKSYEEANSNSIESDNNNHCNINTHIVNTNNNINSNNNGKVVIVKYDEIQVLTVDSRFCQTNV